MQNGGVGDHAGEGSSDGAKGYKEQTHANLGTALADPPVRGRADSILEVEALRDCLMSHAKKLGLVSKTGGKADMVLSLLHI